tara:strand:- start:378 stop:581 length:204 start_codon:yes stop_codon:yes gene_type:complete
MVLIDSIAYAGHFKLDVILANITAAAGLDKPVLQWTKGGKPQTCQNKVVTGGTCKGRDGELCQFGSW